LHFILEGEEMTDARRIKWVQQAEVVVVGYGGAGATAAITAHDAGAKVLIIEKQHADTPSETRHTPSTRMSGGAWFCTPDFEKAILYLEGMVKMANETLNPERKEMIRVFAHYLADNTAWLKNIGVDLGGIESISPSFKKSLEFEHEIYRQVSKRGSPLQNTI
jgi:aspartate oxidase